MKYNIPNSLQPLILLSASVTSAINNSLVKRVQNLPLFEKRSPELDSSIIYLIVFYYTGSWTPELANIQRLVTMLPWRSLPIIKTDVRT
jgi:hypothetical protein